jgi:hypothetical protein
MFLSWLSHCIVIVKRHHGTCRRGVAEAGAKHDQFNPRRGFEPLAAFLMDAIVTTTSRQ